MSLLKRKRGARTPEIGVDYIMNGQGVGNIAGVLMRTGFDPGAMRPYVADDGRSYVDLRGGYDEEGEPIFNTVLSNAPATLTQDEWKFFDDTIIEITPQRLQLVADMREAGMVKTEDLWGYSMMQFRRDGDVTGATIGMDPLRYSETDRPEFEYENIPIPVIWGDINFGARDVAFSHNPGGSFVDERTLRLKTRKVVEFGEQFVAGTASSFTYAGATAYGFLNHPSRTTYTLDDPSQPGWIPEDTVQDLLAIIQLLKDDDYNGPFRVYYSPAWGQYLNTDYSAVKGDRLLLERLQAIGDIADMRQLDSLTSYDMLVIEMTEKTARLVVGMDLTVLQWKTDGDLNLFWKIMMILLNQIFVDANGNTGYVHADIVP